MANLSSIARPYALAAFEYARESKQLPAWKAFLESAAAWCEEYDLSLRLLDNPEVLLLQLFDLFQDVLGIATEYRKKKFFVVARAK